MTPKEALSWHFNGPLTDTCEVQCNGCKVFSPLSEWKEGYVGCEDCGDHAAMCCPQPECYHCEDHVFSDYNPMEVREP